MMILKIISSGKKETNLNKFHISGCAWWSEIETKEKNNSTSLWVKKR